MIFQEISKSSFSKNTERSELAACPMSLLNVNNDVSIDLTNVRPKKLRKIGIEEIVQNITRNLSTGEPLLEHKSQQRSNEPSLQ